MPSHAVRRLLAHAPADDPQQVRATVELQCGCTVSVTIGADRIVERTSGESFAVGKIPCPVGHPVQRPSS